MHGASETVPDENSSLSEMSSPGELRAWPAGGTANSGHPDSMASPGPGCRLLSSRRDDPGHVRAPPPLRLRCRCVHLSRTQTASCGRGADRALLITVARVRHRVFKFSRRVLTEGATCSHSRRQSARFSGNLLISAKYWFKYRPRLIIGATKFYEY